MSGSAPGTTAQALQAAPAPSGMQRIPLPVESYQHVSPPLSSERLLNYYVEQQPGSARTAAALIATGALVIAAVAGTGPILAMDDSLPGRVYLVSGTHGYRLRFEGGGILVDDIGDVGSPDMSGADVPPNQVFVTIATGPTAAVICVPPRAYTCAHDSAAVLVQLGGTFTGAASVAYLDGYWAFSDFSSNGRFFITKLMDPTSFDTLDFAYADALPNVLRRVFAHRGQFWMIGEDGIEVWYDAGNVDFPFRRVPAALIQYGTSNANSVARLDNSVFWLASDFMVYRSVGYNAKRVSTNAIETAIERGGQTNIVGFSWTHSGHSFYCLQTDTRTLVYDVATDKWHDRASSSDGTGKWLAGSVAANAYTRLFGDLTSGNIYTLDNQFNIHADNGVPVLRSATLPPVWAATRRAFCARVELEMESGTDTNDVILEWSDDGGFTWTGGPRTMTSGPPGAHRKRVVATRLGSFRQRVFRIRTLTAVSLYALDADIAAGAS
jgi:hypothetical protein